jgi:hypothetical protein
MHRIRYKHIAPARDMSRSEWWRAPALLVVQGRSVEDLPPVGAAPILVGDASPRPYRRRTSFKVRNMMFLATTTRRAKSSSCWSLGFRPGLRRSPIVAPMATCAPPFGGERAGGAVLPSCEGCSDSTDSERDEGPAVASTGREIGTVRCARTPWRSKPAHSL